MSKAKNDESEFSALLGVNPEIMPMRYARALRPRIDDLLTKDLPQSVRMQLGAVKGAIDDKKLSECTGLSRLHYCLDEWERRYTINDIRQ